MILALKIKNFILVDEINLEFGKHFNVITGETGAGKSVVIGAINAIFDKRTQKEILYNNNYPAYLEATFLIEEHSDFIKQFDIIPENNEIFIAREFLTDGRRKSFINGRRVSQDIVYSLKNHLLDFHNQNKHLNYLGQNFQLDLLDKFADLHSLLLEYKKLYRRITELSNLINEMTEKEKEQKDKIELYKYQFSELADANLTPDEDLKLENSFETLSNAENLLNFFGELNYDFYESENSIYDRLAEKLKRINDFNVSIPILNDAKAILNNIIQNLDEIISLSHKANDTIFIDAPLLEQVKERLDTINFLKNKYNKNLRELIDYKNKIFKYINSYESDNDMISKSKEKLKNEVKKLYELAEKISEIRKEKAKLFARLIQENLKKLSLKNSEFKIRIDKNNAYKEILSGLKIPGIKGFDKVDFFFSANLEKKKQPLKEVVSGGELSRIVLSIKKILAQDFAFKTLIFDEIDSGIGGKTAVVTGDFINEIAQKTQVLCVTHLPQIAANADTHFLIEKENLKENTKISIERLDKKSRVIEIARMLSGNISQKAINHAKEILKM